MLIDTHAHLNDKRYDENREELISSLFDNKVEKVFTVAYNKESIIDSIKLANKYENIYAIIGVHPSDTQDWNEDTKQLIENAASNPKVIAIGEIGLDYHYPNIDKNEQKRVFVEQLQLAHKLQLPICIHNRDSIGDTLEILKSHKDLLECGGVVHCFSESVEVYKEIKKLGLKIAFGGTLTFKNSVQAPAVCKVADIEDILIETDCPYMAPEPFRGTRNDSSMVYRVAEKMAEIKGLPVQEILNITTENAKRFFGI